MDKKTAVYSCSCHIEQAIDDYVNVQETAPRIIENNSNEKCNYCNENAIYIITE